MSKGLKKMVAEATEQEAPALPPVDISGNAMQTMARLVRKWSGWKDARLVCADPRTQGLNSPYAACDHPSRTFLFNPDLLVRNPNRVLFTVTPFRLRQEAIMTGSLLHEVGHARHSHWQPGRYGNPMVLKHKDGRDATAQCVALARLMEEPRVEGLIARDANQIGATGLGWTLRAAAAALLPMTAMSADPNQQLMDLISSWALRAGRQYALEARINHRTRTWVQDFTSLLHQTIVAHLNDRLEAGALDCNPTMDAPKIMNGLLAMTVCDDDTGSTMIDLAREVLVLLFPETPGATDDQQAMPAEGCSGGEGGEAAPSEGAGSPSEDEEKGSGGKGDESGSEAGEGNSDPEDEGSGDEPGEGDAGGEGDEPGDGDSDEEGDTEDTEDDAEGGEDGDDGASDSTADTDTDTDTDSPLAKALASIENRADGDIEDEATKAGEDAEEEAASGNGAGKGAGGGGIGGGYRLPTKDEREVQKGAARFLRDMIDMSESSTTSLTDTPSATVDGSALSAWKAGGRHKAPHFFIRTRRETEPAPPVKIAILVDVSMSMSELQKPSALLSWALSAAALDLRNFAGRGTQVESTMIHWGDDARVIQRNGEPVPGIKSHRCNEGTSAMSEALSLIETEMPGFFDMSEKPVNRLLVQFTDWELYGPDLVQKQIAAALAAGVNMLTVAPSRYRGGDLPGILKKCKVQRGKTSLLKYNSRKPEAVWQQATELL